MSPYVFDQAWQQEHDRLRAIEDLFDDATTRRLSELGTGAGWRCLEVGCGAGSVARWLAERVGRRGYVLATDLDPRFMKDAGHNNLDVRKHDILTDPLEANSFDLVHARLLLEHIPERERALDRMVAAVRPGGWVVIEDGDFAGAMVPAMSRYVHPPEYAALCEKSARGFETLFTAAGWDRDFAPRLPQTLRRAGLEQVAAEVHAPVAYGGSERSFIRLGVEHLRGHLIDAGLLTEAEVDQFLRMSAEPTMCFLPLFMVTVWGRRPD